MVELVARSTGEVLRVALLPFVSQRGVVRAGELLELDAAQMAGAYAERIAAVVADAHRRLHGRGRQRGGRPRHRARRGARRRRAGRPDDLRVLGAGHRLPAVGVLRGARAPPSPPAAAGAGAGLVPGFADRGRLRRGGRHQARGGRRGVAGRAGQGAGRTARVAARPAHRAGHGRRARRAGARPGRRPPARGRHRARPGRPGRRGPPRAAQRPRGAGRALRRRARPGPAGPQGRTPHELFAAYLTELEIDDPRLHRLFADLLDVELSRSSG